jgi:uncharacterized membrane protein (UPF0127 family)
MKKFTLTLDEDNKIDVEVAITEKDRTIGLSNRESSDTGMLFVFPYVGKHQMWMKGTNFPLDIIFLDDDKEVLGVVKGEVGDGKLLGEFDKVQYVLELPIGYTEKFDIQTGDDLPIPEEFSKSDEDATVPGAVLLDDEGKEQMNIRGGERVFSRESTSKFVAGAKSYKTDEDLKKLGKLVANEISSQDARGNEYVDPSKTKYTYAEQGAKINPGTEDTSEWRTIPKEEKESL